MTARSGSVWRHADVAVIGAGVLGCMAARELSRFELDVLVLERAHDVGEGSSKANSGIIHAGFQPRAGSLKGRSCVEGNAAYNALARDLSIAFRRTGGMMVAFSDDGMEKLQEKAARAKANGAPGIEIIDGDAARELEPRLSKKVRHAMLAPSTGVISPFELVLALAQNAHANGVEFCFNAEVRTVERLAPGVSQAGGSQAGGRGSCSGKGDGSGGSASRYLLHCADGKMVEAKAVINAAGDGAMILDAQLRPADFIIKPRLGEYYVFDKQNEARAIRHVIYQAADSDEGGTLLAPTVEGNLLAGPTSRNVRRFGETATSPQGLSHVWQVAKKLVPDLELSEAITNFAGVRTNIANVDKELKDFVVRATAPGFISALGIKNPGMTSAPALAKRMLALLAEQGLELTQNPAFQPQREAYKPFLKCDSAEQKRRLLEDPGHGRVVCRCESVTEGDIRAMLRMPLPPGTLDGVKDRLRCGMGRCQGAYCASRIVSIMAQELGVPEEAIRKGQRGGRLVARRLK
jgi:glycerol-3-phosphate dehydrogenase